MKVEIQENLRLPCGIIIRAENIEEKVFLRNFANHFDVNKSAKLSIISRLSRMGSFSFSITIADIKANEFEQDDK